MGFYFFSIFMNLFSTVSRYGEDLKKKKKQQYSIVNVLFHAGLVILTWLGTSGVGGYLSFVLNIFPTNFNKGHLYS